MGRVILCVGSTAKTPYLLKKPDISVYTVEELCHCIRENSFLMDEDMVCTELADWLGAECGLDDLADSLRRLVRTKASVSVFLSEILRYAGFYPEEEIRRIGRFLDTGAQQSEYERQKNVADYLAGNGKYELAMARYFELLRDIPEEEEALRAKILHNMGYASGRLFLFDSAAGFFYNAYRLSGEEKSFVQFLAAKRLLLDENAYVDFIAEQTDACYQMSLELEKTVQQISEEWRQCRRAQELEDIRKEGETSPENYRRVLEEEAERMKEVYRGMVREK